MTSKPQYTIDELRRLDAVALAIRFHEGASKTPLFAKPGEDQDAGPTTMAQLLADADTIRHYTETGERLAGTPPAVPVWWPPNAPAPATDWWRLPPWELTKVWCSTVTTGQPTPLAKGVDY